LYAVLLLGAFSADSKLQKQTPGNSEEGLVQNHERKTAVASEQAVPAKQLATEAVAVTDGNKDTYSDCWCLEWNTGGMKNATACKHWSCWGEETLKTQCFSAGSVVMRADGTSVSLENLRVGDSIITLDAQHNRVVDTVFGFLHRDASAFGHFLHIKHSSGVLRVSGKHIVFAHGSTVFAEELHVGDLLLTASGFSEIESIERAVSKGVFAPITHSGTLLVDGALASCYAHCPSHSVAHAVMAPWRWWSMLWSSLSDVKTSSQPEGGVHSYPSILHTLVSPFKLTGM